MRCPFALLLALIVCVPAAAHAQVAAYLTYSPVEFDYFNGSGSTPVSNSGIVQGVGGGVTIDHLHEGRFHTAVDLRASFNSKTYYRGGTGAADYRIAFIPKRVALRPFVQLGVGFVTAHDPSSNYLKGPSTTDAVLDLAFGLDIRLTPRVDLRLLEIGGAAPFRRGTNSSPTIGAGVISTGAVYHF